MTGFRVRAMQGACALALLAVAAAPAAAQDRGIDYLALQLGAYDFGAFDGGNDLSAGFGLEYRAGFGVWWVHPFLGLMGTSDGGIYGYGGLLLDVPLGSRFFLTPSAAVGGFDEGSGQDLGHAVEFRTAIEVTYRFDNNARLGVMFQHMSNADLGGSNPGSESVFVTYAHPLKGLFGN